MELNMDGKSIQETVNLPIDQTIGLENFLQGKMEEMIKVYSKGRDDIENLSKIGALTDKEKEEKEEILKTEVFNMINQKVGLKITLEYFQSLGIVLEPKHYIIVGVSSEAFFNAGIQNLKAIEYNRSSNTVFNMLKDMFGGN